MQHKDAHDSPESFSEEDLARIFTHAAQELKQNTKVFCAIDSRFGDGDHGVTMNKIADCILATVSAWDTVSGPPIKTFLDNLGTAVMGLSGGSAGPLWGTLLGGLALPLTDTERSITGARLADMLESSLAEMKDITTARVGDKTMMDTLIPAVEAARPALDAGADAPAILRAVAQAAQQGASHTEQCIARYGRAKSYKEQTLGTPDAGAVSLSLFFVSLAE